MLFELDLFTPSHLLQIAFLWVIVYFVLRYLLGYHGDLVSPGFEYGSAFILTAGLMNLLLVLDAWDHARGRK